MQHLSRRFSGYVYLYVAVASICPQIIYAFISWNPLRFPNFSYITLRLVFSFIIFVPPLVMAAVRKYPVAQALRLNAFQAKYAWYAIGIGICLVLFIHPLNLLINNLMLALLNQTEQSYFGSVSPSLWPYILTSCLIPALFETTAFQGIVQTGLHDVKPLKACLIVGLLYGLIIVGSNAAIGISVLNVFGYAIYGFALSYVVMQSGSTFPAMITAFAYYLCRYGDLKDVLYQYCLSPLGASQIAAASILLILAAGIGILLLTKMPRTKDVSMSLRLPSFREFRQRLTQPYIPSPDEGESEAITEAAPEPAAPAFVDPLREAANAAGDTAKNRNVGFIVGGTLLAALSLAVLVYGIVMIAIQYSDNMN